MLPQLVLGVGAKGKPPTKPGKPETATFRLWIGVWEEDVVLTSPNYFDIVTSVGGWYPDEGMQRGRKVHGHRWQIPIFEDRHGTYEMKPLYSENYETVLTEFYKGELSQVGWLEHHWKPGEYDDWTIDITWDSGKDLDGDGVSDPYFLDGWTGLRTPEEEGTYDSDSDTWSVTFSNAYFDIDWWGPGGDNGKHVVWDGNLSFTVKIQKLPS